VTPKPAYEDLERTIRELEEESIRSRQAEQEAAILAAIGRLISSTLNIDEVYERFALEARKLIHFDSITINLYWLHDNPMRVAYVSGVDIDGRRQGDPLVLKGSLSEEVIRTRTGLLVQPADLDEALSRFPRLAVIFQAGLRSIICVPLVYRDEVIGVLHFRSKEPHAYTQPDLRLAERIAAQIAGAVANAELFAERKKAAEALRESKNRYDRLTNTVPVMLYDSMIRPDGTTRFLYVTPQPCRELFELDPEALLANVILLWDMIHPEDVGRFHQEEMAANREGRVFSAEVRIITPSGRLKWVIIDSRPNPAAPGEPVVWSGFIKDITERKQAEERLAAFEAQFRQLQKAESLSRMAGAVAHNFNNLLGAVMGNLELAMNNLPPGPDIGQKLARAMKAAGRAAEVSGLMLAYLGQGPSRHEPLDLSEVCRRSLPMLRDSMPKEADLEADLPAPGPTIEADGHQIRQVLTNLVTNACEALDEGRGTIRLAVKTVSPVDIPAARRFPPDWQPQDDLYACLEVADTGCGIAEKDIENLFDPFFTSKFTGRGMGLSVVLGALRAHDGAVTVESEAGRGSVLRVFFPMSTETVHRQPEEEIRVPKIVGGGTALLVDDEEAVREIAADMLRDLGFAVLDAKDGVEAVELFRRHKDAIRFVLCDLTMPRLDGWETLAALRKLAPGIPVILTSGYDRAQVMAGDHAEWPQAFLGKPYRSAGFHDAIRQALESEKGGG
jgi:PAS domain S-box-containing protein